MGAGSHGRRIDRRYPASDGDLVTVVVEYPGGADRCTIYPAGLSETERLTRWLSADAEAFESLSGRR